jgi:hypothetical protein
MGGALVQNVRNHRVSIALTIASVIGFGIFIYRLNDRPLERAALTYRDTLLSRNASRIYAIMTHQEKAAIELTSEEFKRFYDTIYLPIFDKLKCDGPVSAEGNGLYGMADRECTLPNGIRVPVAGMAYPTESEIMWSVTGDLFAMASYYNACDRDPANQHRSHAELRKAFYYENAKRFQEFNVAGYYDPKLQKLKEWPTVINMLNQYHEPLSSDPPGTQSP